MTTTKADPKWGWRMRVRPPLYTFYCMALQQDVLGDFIVLLINLPGQHSPHVYEILHRQLYGKFALVGMKTLCLYFL